MFVDWQLRKVCVFVRTLEKNVKNFFNVGQRVDRASFSFLSLEVFLRFGVLFHAWVFAGSPAASSTSRWVARLAIWTFGVFLLHVGVQSWVGKVRFIA